LQTPNLGVPFQEPVISIPLQQLTMVRVCGQLTAQETVVAHSLLTIVKTAMIRTSRVKSNFSSLGQSSIGLFLRIFLKSQSKHSAAKAALGMVAAVDWERVFKVRYR
jgi:hypothetical protein